MVFNMKLLKDAYDEAVRNGNICYVNEDKEPEDIGFDEFKEYIIRMVISNLQYDFHITTNLYNIIEEVEE